MADVTGTPEDYSDLQRAVVRAQSSSRWDDLSEAEQTLISKFQGLDYDRGAMLTWCLWSFQRCYRHPCAGMPAYPDPFGHHSSQDGQYSVLAPELVAFLKRHDMYELFLENSECITTYFPTYNYLLEGVRRRNPQRTREKNSRKSKYMWK